MMTTCNDSVTNLATSSPAESAPAADANAVRATIGTPQIEAPKSETIETVGGLSAKANDVPVRAAPQRLDESSIKALSAVAAIVEAPSREATLARAKPLMADDPPLSARSGRAVPATPVATAQKPSSRF